MKVRLADPNHHDLDRVTILNDLGIGQVAIAVGGNAWLRLDDTYFLCFTREGGYALHHICSSLPGRISSVVILPPGTKIEIESI